MCHLEDKCVWHWIQQQFESRFSFYYHPHWWLSTLAHIQWPELRWLNVSIINQFSFTVQNPTELNPRQFVVCWCWWKCIIHIRLRSLRICSMSINACFWLYLYISIYTVCKYIYCTGVNTCWIWRSGYISLILSSVKHVTIICSLWRAVLNEKIWYSGKIRTIYTSPFCYNVFTPGS